MCLVRGEPRSRSCTALACQQYSDAGQKADEHFSITQRVQQVPFPGFPPLELLSTGDEAVQKGVLGEGLPVIKGGSFLLTVGAFLLRVELFLAYSPFCWEENQGKTKGQELKGKIVSEFSHFLHFFTHFQNFSPRTFPFKTNGFSSIRTKEKKRQ